MVKREKKRPATSSSIFDFYESGGPQGEANKLMGDGKKTANNY